MSYEIIFDPNYKNSEAYHRQLEIQHPEARIPSSSHSDRECIILGEKMSIPLITHKTTNRELVHMFSLVLLDHFVKESVCIYPPDHFDIMFERGFGMPSVTKDDYVKKFYKAYKMNDHSLITMEVLVFTCVYGHTWHTVVVDKPMNSTIQGETCNVYVISCHNVQPQYAIAKMITKYVTMGLWALKHEAIPENFVYHELILAQDANQPHVICCLYAELACRIVEKKADMSMLFDGIKKEVYERKMEHYVFSRYLQTLLNCFAVEYNPHGQIAEFDVILIEEQDFIWTEGTDLNRILDPAWQLRNRRPIHRFSKKRNTEEKK